MRNWLSLVILPVRQVSNKMALFRISASAAQIGLLYPVQYGMVVA
jgi:hypothetical protein